MSAIQKGAGEARPLLARRRPWEGSAKTAKSDHSTMGHSPQPPIWTHATMSWRSTPP